MLRGACVKSKLMAAIPKMAATIILVREGKEAGFEVFLLKRHEKSSFMGGNYVYPGGRVDREDGLPEIFAFCQGISKEWAHQAFRGALSPEESLAHWVAGIRELFEEAGVLFAYDQTGRPFVSQNPLERDRFLSYRDQLEKGKMTFLQLAQEGKLLFALDQLHYYAHWITPQARPERFDTRFFLARHPTGQEASHDQKETTIGLWITPQKALEENSKGGVVLSPPTLKTLEDLSRYESIDGVLNSLKGNEIRPVLPILTRIPGQTLILFPWDPEYEIFQSGKVPDHAEHGRPSEPGDNTTRLLLNEGRWLPYCKIT